MGATVAVADDRDPRNDTAGVNVDVLGVDAGIGITDLGTGDSEIGTRRAFDVQVDSRGGLPPLGAFTMRLTPGPGLVDTNIAGDGWTCGRDDADWVCTSPFPLPAIGDLPVIHFDAYVGGNAWPNTRVDVQVATGAGYAEPDGDFTLFDVVGAADLIAHAEALDLPFTVGAQDAIAVTVENRGQVAADGPIEIDGFLPPGMTFVEGGPDPWVCSAADGDFGCTTPRGTRAGRGTAPRSSRSRPRRRRTSSPASR